MPWKLSRHLFMVFIINNVSLQNYLKILKKCFLSIIWILLYAAVSNHQSHNSALPVVIGHTIRVSIFYASYIRSVWSRSSYYYQQRRNASEFLENFQELYAWYNSQNDVCSRFKYLITFYCVTRHKRLTLL